MRPRVYYLDEVMSYRRAGCPRQSPMPIGRWRQGLKQGDCVALFMENRPDFLCSWLGLFKAGLCVALINTNQRGQPLAHSIEIAGAAPCDRGRANWRPALPEAEAFFDASRKSGFKGR